MKFNPLPPSSLVSKNPQTPISTTNIRFNPPENDVSQHLHTADDHRMPFDDETSEKRNYARQGRENDRFMRKQYHSLPIGATFGPSSRDNPYLHRTNKADSNAVGDLLTPTLGNEKGTRLIPFPHLLNVPFGRGQSRDHPALKSIQSIDVCTDRMRRKRSMSGAPSVSSFDDGTKEGHLDFGAGIDESQASPRYQEHRGSLNPGLASYAASACSSLKPPRKRRRYGEESNGGDGNQLGTKDANSEIRGSEIRGQRPLDPGVCPTTQSISSFGAMSRPRRAIPTMNFNRRKSCTENCAPDAAGESSATRMNAYSHNVQNSCNNSPTKYRRNSAIDDGCRFENPPAHMRQTPNYQDHHNNGDTVLQEEDECTEEALPDVHMKHMDACRNGLHLPWMRESIATVCYETLDLQRRAMTPRENRTNYAERQTPRTPQSSKWISLNHPRAKDVLRSLPHSKPMELASANNFQHPHQLKELPSDGIFSFPHAQQPQNQSVNLKRISIFAAAGDIEDQEDPFNTDIPSGLTKRQSIRSNSYQNRQHRESQYKQFNKAPISNLQRGVPNSRNQNGTKTPIHNEDAAIEAINTEGNIKTQAQQNSNPNMTSASNFLQRNNFSNPYQTAITLRNNQPNIDNERNGHEAMVLTAEDGRKFLLKPASSSNDVVLYALDKDQPNMQQSTAFNGKATFVESLPISSSHISHPMVRQEVRQDSIDHPKSNQINVDLQNYNRPAKLENGCHSSINRPRPLIPHLFSGVQQPDPYMTPNDVSKQIYYQSSMGPQLQVGYQFHGQKEHMDESTCWRSGDNHGQNMMEQLLFTTQQPPDSNFIQFQMGPSFMPPSSAVFDQNGLMYVFIQGKGYVPVATNKRHSEEMVGDQGNNMHYPGFYPMRDIHPIATPRNPIQPEHNHYIHDPRPLTMFSGNYDNYLQNSHTIPIKNEMRFGSVGQIPPDFRGEHLKHDGHMVQANFVVQQPPNITSAPQNIMVNRYSDANVYPNRARLQASEGFSRRSSFQLMTYQNAHDSDLKFSQPPMNDSTRTNSMADLYESCRKSVDVETEHHMSAGGHNGSFASNTTDGLFLMKERPYALNTSGGLIRPKLRQHHANGYIANGLNMRSSIPVMPTGQGNSQIIGDRKISQFQMM